MNKAAIHIIYSSIILLLLGYLVWSLPTASDDTFEPEAVQNEAAQTFTHHFSALPNEHANSDHDELLQELTQQRQQIKALQTQLEELNAQPIQTASAPASTTQLATTLSNDEITDLYMQQQAQREIERDEAFANARHTAASDQAQQKIETSIYSLDSAPRFEDLDVECREIYCNIEIIFETAEEAREFMISQGQNIFNQAGVQTTMTRSQTYGSEVVIKADLAPLTED